MAEITLFVCPPKTCEHSWDKWVPIMGEHEEECGQTLACSKCGMTKFDQSQWELP